MSSNGTEVTETGDAGFAALMPTYARFALKIVKGKGSYVWDDEGQRYLDFTAGVATCNLGHVPDPVQKRLQEQLDTLWHCSNFYRIPSQERLAALLTTNSCMSQAFFCNSGAEANEAAIKLARRYWQMVKETDRTEIVTFKQSFHGRTMATLSATGQEKIQQGFTPLVEGFRTLPYNDDEALMDLIGPQTGAVMLEFVQGEGGVIPADKQWIQRISDLCQTHGVLLIADEIQTGMGRTGSLFAYEQYGVEPDIITLAKGLGSGVPIGAMLAKEDVAEAFGPGSHGSTFGGNPLATTAAVATVEVMTNDGFMSDVQQLGAYVAEKLEQLQARHGLITNIRGKGLLWGIVLSDQGKALDVVHVAREQHHVLLLIAGPDVVRLAPPLNTTTEEIDHVIDVLDHALLAAQS